MGSVKLCGAGVKCMPKENMSPGTGTLRKNPHVEGYPHLLYRTPPPSSFVKAGGTPLCSMQQTTISRVLPA